MLSPELNASSCAYCFVCANLNQPFRYTLRRTLASISADSNAAAAQQTLRLPPPVTALAAEEADSDPFCAESADLQQYATNSSGWSWGNWVPMQCPHPNCQTLGFHTYEPSSTLTLVINTMNSTHVTNSAVLDRRNLVAVYSSGHANTKRGTVTGGSAQLACVHGCRCKRMILSKPHPSSLGGNLILATTKVSMTVVDI
jgi:hypothetical protein